MGLRTINAALDRSFGKGQIHIHRSPAGYYYFSGDHERSIDIESIYVYKLTDTPEQVVTYVRAQLAKEI